MKESAASVRKSIFFGLGIALVSLVFLYGSLFEAKPWGINIPILFLLFYGALFLQLRGKISLLRNQNWLLLLLAFACSLSFLFFSNSLLLFLNLVAMAILSAAQIALMTAHFARAPFSLAFGADISAVLFVKPFHRIAPVYQGIFSSGQGKGKIWGAACIGIVICFPILAILILLLTSADAIFSNLMGNLFHNINFFKILGWLFFFVAAFTLSASFFASTAGQYQKPQMPPQSQPRPWKHFAAIYAVLIPVALLLLVFAGVQICYLFGSSPLPQGYTYATYARTGFFQLTVAAILVFSLLALCMHITRFAQGKQKTGLRIVYSVLILSIFILIASSFLRMMLYEQAFGFTRLRIYVQAFLICLALFTLLAGIKIWAASFSVLRFCGIALVCCLLGLTFFNADAFIAKKNLAMMDAQGKTLSKETLSELVSLSPDALPIYASRLTPDLLKQLYEKANQEGGDWWLYEGRLYRQYQDLLVQNKDFDFRYYNIGRAKAKEALLAQDPAIFETLAKFEEWDEDQIFSQMP